MYHVRIYLFYIIYLLQRKKLLFVTEEDTPPAHFDKFSLPVVNLLSFLARRVVIFAGLRPSLSVEGLRAEPVLVPVLVPVLAPVTVIAALNMLYW